MKKLILFFALTLNLVSGFAFAHGNNLSMSADSLALVAEMYEKEFAANLKTFSGVKVWPAEHMIYVKVYHDNNTKSVQYHCHMNGEKLECLKSN